uniref:Uncharacterized protein n=1 Tax=Rhizophora mucronata TaxID=61149 RepID=A0A2P2QS60_RHIMU
MWLPPLSKHYIFTQYLSAFINHLGSERHLSVVHFCYLTYFHTAYTVGHL